MDFPAARALVPELVVAASSPSTNAELADRARTGALPSFSTLVTLDQTAGRGRLGRVWSAPAGTSLAISVLVAPRGSSGAALPFERFGWFGIAAGVAMTETVRALLPTASTAFKWPNDVLITGGDGTARKVCGVLAELIAERAAVVVGAGVNLTMARDQLPVDTATSLVLEGLVDIDADTVLAGYLGRLRAHVDAYAAADGDAEASGLRARALALCSTIGRDVRVELPDGRTVAGAAVDLDADGRLQVRTGDGSPLSVSAGDVTHLRHG